MDVVAEKFHLHVIRPMPEPEVRARQQDGRTNARPDQGSLLKRLGAFLAEYTPLDYALEPIIRTGSLYTLTAPTGTGKTAWLISVALAIATGDRRILGMDVEKGRVALLTFENPDDVRMRLMVASCFWAIDVRTIDDALVIIDARLKPEDVLVVLDRESWNGGFRLVLIDTLAAFFDGDNLNDNVQGGNFMRRLRPLTRTKGLPAVVVAAHPVKSVTSENVIPYGGGAILNEVDGNLTLWRKSDGPHGMVELHWQGKLRGLDFQPIPWRFEITQSPDVLDAKGRQVSLPVMVPVVLDAADAEMVVKADYKTGVDLLNAIITHPEGTQVIWASAIGRSQGVVSTTLKRLERERLVERVLGKVKATDKGKKLTSSQP